MQVNSGLRIDEIVFEIIFYYGQHRLTCLWLFLAQTTPNENNDFDDVIIILQVLNSANP